MPLSILAVPTDPRTARACLDAAATAAAADPASRLTVLHVHIDPESLILPTEEVMTGKRRAALDAAANRESQAIRATFDAWRKDTGVAAAWDEVVGTVEAEVVSRGKPADLIVLAHALESEGREALHAAIFETGRLLLYAPAAASARFGQHVVIAWKECDQAKAAVAAALPWLKAAARVSVLAIGVDEPPTPPQDLLAMLGSKGVKADPVLMAEEDEEIGARILHEAHEIGADCLVMGAYRHGEFVERLLGGATRHVLQAADLPVFLHH
jgi:nucleotide-binding universal stress UspA family protein